MTFVINACNKRPWMAPLIVSGVLIIGLFGLVPYNFGYEHVPKTVFQMLQHLWKNATEWQHGIVVPFISMGLIVWKWDSLKKTPVKGTWWGFVALAFSLFVYWVGYKVDLTAVGFIALQGTIGSLIIWFLGWRWFWALFFPWLFLMFTWPFTFLEGPLAFKLRLVMSSMSHSLLQLMGVDTILSGTAIISAPNESLGLAKGALFQLDVANPCSGIRSLFALMMLSALYGYMTLPRIWQRSTMFLLSLPLAVVGNMARILLLTFGTLWFGSEWAIGSHEHPTTFHLFAGFFVFMVALGGMAGAGWVMDWIDEKMNPDDYVSEKPSEPETEKEGK